MRLKVWLSQLTRVSNARNAAACAEQVIDLVDHGVTELHFYTMNRADLVFAICHLIGLRAKPKVEAEAA